MNTTLRDIVSVLACIALMEGCSAAGGSALPIAPTTSVAPATANVADDITLTDETPDPAGGATVQPDNVSAQCPSGTSCRTALLLRPLIARFSVAGLSVAQGTAPTKVTLLTKRTIVLDKELLKTDASCGGSCEIVASYTPLKLTSYSVGLIEGSMVQSGCEVAVRSLRLTLLAGTYYLYLAKG